MEDTTRMDIRRLLKTFGVKADELIMAHVMNNPDALPLRVKVTLEDLTDYGDHSPAEPLELVVEGMIGEGR